MASGMTEIQQTLDAYKSGLAPAMGFLSPDAQKDWNLATGFQPYNLEPIALMLFPVLSPVRNLLPRVKGKGRKAEYKAVTAVNNTALRGFVADGASGPVVKTTTEDMTATYRSMALADFVTFEQQWGGNGFLDTKGTAVVNLLRSLMITEDYNILFGQNSTAASGEQAPGAVGAAPTITSAVSAITGGSIASGTTYAVKQTVITGAGESTPSASEKTFTIASGSTGSCVVTPVFPSGQPVIGFRIYAGATGGPYYLVVSADAASIPSSATIFNGLTCTTNGSPITITTIPVSGTQPPAADTTGTANDWNGIYTQMWGGTGATLLNQNGTLTQTEIQSLFTGIWNTANGDPDNIFCNVQESTKITNITLGAGAPYYVMVNQQNQAGGLFRVARLTNGATGSEVPVKVHPKIPQGTLLALSTALPGWYAPSGIKNVMEMDCNQDYIEIDYPPQYNTTNGDQWSVAVKLFATPKLYVPGLCGAIYGISNS